MREFEKNGKRVQTFTAESIEEEYRNLLNYYRNIFSNLVIYTIQEEIRGIPEYKINDWIEEMLIDEIKKVGNRTTNNIYNSLMDNFGEFLDYINKNQKSNEMMEMYEKEINNVVRNIKDSMLDDVIEEYRIYMIRRLTYYCDPFNGITEQNIEEKIDNINTTIRQKLRRKCEEFIDEYKGIVQKKIRKNIDNIGLLFDQIKQEVMTEEEFKAFEKCLKYNNYQLVKEGEELYAINLKTQQKIVLKYNSKNKILNNPEKTIGFQLTESQYQSVDKQNNKIVIIKSNSFQSCNLEFKYHIAIVDKIEDYEFYYNKEKVTTEEEISVVIDKLKRESPEYYQELQKNPIFKEIENKVNKYQEDKKEIYINESDGILKIVPNKKEKLFEKFKIIGYELIEKEDGLYAKDLKNNTEHKIKYEYGYCYFEGIDPTKTSFAPNITIVTEENINENNVIFKSEKGRLRTNQELTKFVITIDEKTYKILFEENKIICNAKGKNEEKIELSTEEIISIVSTQFPYLVEYLNNKRNQLSEIQKENKTTTEEIASTTIKR